MYKNILVTTDGSEFAERGLIHGFDTAKAMGSKVTVLTVTAPYSLSGLPGGFTDSPAFIERYEEEWNDYASSHLNHRNRKRIAQRPDCDGVAWSPWTERHVAR
jgi:nucleotide-binding universal stress UspA family protein